MTEVLSETARDQFFCCNVALAPTWRLDGSCRLYRQQFFEEIGNLPKSIHEVDSPCFAPQLMTLIPPGPDTVRWRENTDEINNLR